MCECSRSLTFAKLLPLQHNVLNNTFANRYYK